MAKLPTHEPPARMGLPENGGPRFARPERNLCFERCSGCEPHHP